jgi:uncharacterized membrane protein
MKKERIIQLILVLSALVPPIFLMLTWENIPDTIPVHYDHQMRPDRFGSKNSLIWMSLIFSGISFLLYVLFRNIHRFDPKRLNKPSSNFPMLAAVIVFFLSVMSMMIILSASKNSGLMENLLFPFLGLLFAIIGHFMRKIQPNYFAGIRIPWTLNDDENWKSTHELAGKLWFYSGLVFAAISLLIPFRFILVLFIAMMVIIILIPAIHSYKFFKRKTAG